MITASPLDQFAIFPVLSIKISNVYLSFTNPALFMLLTLSLVLLLLHFVTKKGGGKLVPNAWQSIVEMLYDFVLNLVNEQIAGQKGNLKQKFFPCILVVFTFLLFRNLQGMIPYSFTVTSHFLITLGLSFSIFIGITIVGFQKNGLHFLSISLPAGVPITLAPFLVLLELISYSFRALSLGIRLFANMMAGHSLFRKIINSIWGFLQHWCSVETMANVAAVVVIFVCLQSGEAFANTMDRAIVVQEWTEQIRTQPAIPIPWSPETFVPEIPVLDAPLFDDTIRRTQLYYRLGPHAIVNNLPLPTIVDLIYPQVTIDKHLEAALIHDGISPFHFIKEINYIRGFAFYPNGSPVSAKTLAKYIAQITQLGTRQSTPYRRIINAIKNYELLQAYFLRFRNRTNQQ